MKGLQRKEKGERGRVLVRLATVYCPAPASQAPNPSGATARQVPASRLGEPAELHNWPMKFHRRGNIQGQWRGPTSLATPPGSHLHGILMGWDPQLLGWDSGGDPAREAAVCR